MNSVLKLLGVVLIGIGVIGLALLGIAAAKGLLTPNGLLVYFHGQSRAHFISPAVLVVTAVSIAVLGLLLFIIGKKHNAVHHPTTAQEERAP